MTSSRAAVAGCLFLTGAGLCWLARYLYRERKAWLLAGPVPDDPDRQNRAIDFAAAVVAAYGAAFLAFGLALAVTDVSTDLVGYAVAVAAVGGGAAVALIERLWIR